MSRSTLVAAFVAANFLLTGLSVEPAHAGPFPVGSTPVFIPPIILPTAPTARPPSGQTSGSSVNPVTTTAIVSSLNVVSAFCGGVGGSYAIDCIAAGMAEISREYARTEGYEETSQALADAAKQLNQIARENRSSTQRRAGFKSQDPGGPRTSRPLTPVDSAKLDIAVAQALGVISNTETLLLRSANTSAVQIAQFQQIADAVGSNKVLLRSV